MKIRYNFKDNSFIEQELPSEENVIGEVFKRSVRGVNNNSNLTINAKNLGTTVEKKYSDVYSIELILD